MQKLIETLKGFGLEIPEEKHAEVKKALSAHYKNVAEHDKAISKLAAERDKWKSQAETAGETLKGFEGKDFDTITRERDEWKKKAEDAEKDYNAKIEAREKSDLLSEALKDIKFTSEAAKKYIVAQLENEVGMKNGKLIGFNDLLNGLKESDASAFVDETQEHLEQNRAQFAPPQKKEGGGSILTRKDIDAIKDPSERQRQIAAHIELYKK